MRSWPLSRSKLLVSCRVDTNAFARANFLVRRRESANALKSKGDSADAFVSEESAPLHVWPAACLSRPAPSAPCKYAGPLSAHIGSR